eukprot:scaffold26428_cov75-Phaeocystis_antarctica.AAC.2
MELEYGRSGEKTEKLLFTVYSCETNIIHLLLHITTVSHYHRPDSLEHMAHTNYHNEAVSHMQPVYTINPSGRGFNVTIERI